MNEALQLSATVLTLNEEANLPRCLVSVRDLAAEVIVIDSGSTDRTRDVAVRAGARFEVHTWAGAVRQNNVALGRATGAWVLLLGADEVVSPELAASIRGLFAHGEPEEDGFRVALRTLYLGNVSRDAWSPDSSLYSYSDLYDRLDRTIGYARVAGRIRSARDVSWYRPFVSPPAAFLKHLLFKHRWRDGRRGWIVSYTALMSTFLKYAFLLERRLTPVAEQKEDWQLRLVRRSSAEWVEIDGSGRVAVQGRTSRLHGHLTRYAVPRVGPPETKPPVARVTPPPRHVLVARTDRLGDMLLTLPAIHAVKRAHPACRVTVLASPANADAARHDAAVDEVVVGLGDGASGAGAVLSLARRLRRLHCDVAVVAHSTPQVAKVLYLAGIPVRIGRAGRKGSWFYSRRVPARCHYWTHESERHLDLFELVGVDAATVSPLIWHVQPDELASIEALLRERRALDARLVVLHPGHGGSAPTWPAEKSIELGRRLVQRGVYVAVTGSSGEATLTRRVSDAIGRRALDLGGQLTLSQLGALLKRSALYVGSATGPTHLAAAVGTPLLALFSRLDDPERWRPLGPRTIVLRAPNPLSCPSCLGPLCPDRCMDNYLSVDEAESSALILLDSTLPLPAF